MAEDVFGGQCPPYMAVVSVVLKKLVVSGDFSMGIVIEIDHRERNAGIIEILRAKDGFVVEEKNLSVGDYFVNRRVTVERKTTRDFVVSIIDGRLFSQASRLKRRTEAPLMVVEGVDLFHT